MSGDNSKPWHVCMRWQIASRF